MAICLLFTLNGLRPLYRPMVVSGISFFAGWLTVELALHHVVWQAAFAVCVFHDGTCEDLCGEDCELAIGKYLGDGTTCLTDIPAVSEWGLLVMALLGLAAGTIMFRQAKRRAVSV